MLKNPASTIKIALYIHYKVDNIVKVKKGKSIPVTGRGAP
jgi:hypothetical protein